MYLVQHKVNINWPNYFVSRMFAIKKCNIGSSLCYVYMILKFLKHFCIGMPNLQNISPGYAQEFTMSIMKHMGYPWDDDLKVYYYKMKGFGKIICNYDDSTEFGIDERQVEEQVPNVDAYMVDTHIDDDNAWQGGVAEYEDPQGQGQRQQNSWTQHGTTYRNPSGIVSTSDESPILTQLDYMHVEQHGRHEEESRRCDEFEAAQVERFREVHEHMTTHGNNFNSFASCDMEQFNEIHQNMASNHAITQAGIHNMISYQNENHHYYLLFYREMYDLWNSEYGVNGATWFRGRGRGRGQSCGCGHQLGFLVGNVFYAYIYICLYVYYVTLL